MKSFSSALLGFLVALPALAAEGGDGNIFAGDLGNMIWTVVIFVLVLLVLGKFAWGPILEGLQARENFIRESLEEAKADRESAEERLREYEVKLAEARAEATALVEEGRRDAELVRQTIAVGHDHQAVLSGLCQLGLQYITPDRNHRYRERQCRNSLASGNPSSPSDLDRPMAAASPARPPAAFSAPT